MERVGAFISKLQQQYQQNAGNASMLLTTQMLLAELQQHADNNNTNGKVAVVMPYMQPLNVAPFPEEQPVPDEQPIPPSPPEVPPLQPDTIREPDIQPEIPVQDPPEVPQPQPEEIPPPAAPPAINTNIGTYGLTPANPAFFMPDEVPTLSQQEEKKETDLLKLKTPAEGEETSLNDKLKNHTANELVNRLQEGPIKDLKKAIGINDRYLFINELFRGDETMYERSIKTINSFNIYPEAAYWIQREMKYKLGWDDENPTVKQFNQLVRRRFS